MTIAVLVFDDSINTECLFSFFSKAQKQTDDGLKEFVLIPETDDILKRYLLKTYKVHS